MSSFKDNSGLEEFKPITVEYKYFDRETNFIEVK